MAGKIVLLDVREMLKAGEEPFAKIMEAVDGLDAEDILELHATFRPDPLIRVLGRQGMNSAVAKEAEDHFIVQFYHDEDEFPYFHLDNRELDPPNPMVRTLEFLENHAPCEKGELGVEIWNVRVPAILIPELEDRGFSYAINDEENGTVRIKIRRAG